MARPSIYLFPAPVLRKASYATRPTLLICEVCRTVFARFNGTRGCSERCRLILHLRKYTEKMPDGCWLWRGSAFGYGYLVGKAGGKRYLAHRFSYEVSRGTIPDGLVLHHLCKNKLCVNPEHLLPVTLIENLSFPDGAIGVQKHKTHCKRGHPFDEANTFIRKDGGRICRECSRIKGRENQRRLRRMQRVKKE